MFEMAHIRMDLLNFRKILMVLNQTTFTGVLFGASFIGAVCYFYITSRRKPIDQTLRIALGVVPGLSNLGNTCYINALLQGLASSHAFLEWLSSIDLNIVKNDSAHFLFSLKNVLFELNDSAQLICSSENVIEALHEHRWHIPTEYQQDLYELFNVFVTTWDEEIHVLQSNSVHSSDKSNSLESRQKKVNNSVITLNGLRNKVNDYDIVDNYSDFLGESSDGEYSNHSDAVESNLLPSNNNFSLELETDNDPSLIKRSPPISKKKIAFQDETGFFSGLPPPNFKVQFERIKPPCSGMLAIQLQCCRMECRYKKVRKEKFCGLSLCIPKYLDQSTLSLHLLLRRFFNTEFLSDAQCDECEKKNLPVNGLMKKQGFYQLPQMLMLRIERVDYSRFGSALKKAVYVSFPLVLDVRNFIFSKNDHLSNVSFCGNNQETTSNSSSNIYMTNNENKNAIQNSCCMNDGVNTSGKKYQYSLKAVSVHIGGPHSGHFITYRRGIGTENQDIWYRTSDSSVVRVSYSQVASAEAYMLYYDKICL